MRRRTLAAVLALGTALGGVPAWAESLADSMVAAYRHSSLLDQNRALLRAADEDVASATAQYGPTDSSGASQHYVALELDAEGTQKFSEATTRIAAEGGTISIWMDDTMISNPTVNQAITSSSAVITGNRPTATSGTPSSFSTSPYHVSDSNSPSGVPTIFGGITQSPFPW